MSTKQGFESAALRARLKHPVIDSDGHWVEFGPDLMDYLKDTAPDIYNKLLGRHIDTRRNYRDSNWAKKRPNQAGRPETG